MSWETVEALPGGSDGGAFRGGAEPIVAQRIGLRPTERLRVFWHSDPDHPVARTGERVVVTPHYVYVHRKDGAKLRAPLDRLHGERLDRGRVIYGVKDGDDLLLPYRDRCEVQERLAAVVRGGEPVEPWRDTHNLVATLLFAIPALAVGVGLYVSYPIATALDRIAEGLYTAESVLGTAGAFGLLALGVFLFLWAPSRWRIDAVAVTRSRGVIPWLSFSVPPDRFRRAVIQDAHIKPKNRPRQHIGWRVDLELREPTRVGSFFGIRRVTLLLVQHGGAMGLARSEKRAEAVAFANRLQRLLSLEPTA